MKIKLSDIKAKIVSSKDIKSDQVLINSYTYEDQYIDAKTLAILGYAAPDDLKFDCCFEVVPFTLQGDASSISENSDMNGDLDLVCTDGNCVIQVHKLILSKQTPVLKRFLEKPEVERTKRFKVSYTSDVVKEMVRYIYTGKVNRIIGKEKELVQIANEFDITGMNDFIENVLKNALNKSNAIETIILAEKINLNVLKQAAVEFIKRYEVNFKWSIYGLITNLFTVITKISSFRKDSSS